MKLADRIAQLEARVHELEQRPTLNVSSIQSRRVEAARIAGKRSAEVRRSKTGSAQPKPRTIPERNEPAESSNVAPNEDQAELARTCRTILDNPTEVWRLRTSVVAAVERVMIAWSAPFGITQIRLGSVPAKDADLRAILDALAAGYPVDVLARAGDLGAEDLEMRTEDSPGPSSFTLAVLQRLVGPPEPA